MTHDDIELDLTYALGEIQNIQSELETYFDPMQGIVWANDAQNAGRAADLAIRLEGVEARLKEIEDRLPYRIFRPEPGSYVFTES